MGDLISKSAYREKLVDYNRHLAAREKKATAEEDYEELNAIQNECRAYFMMLSLLDDMPTAYDVEAVVAELEELADYNGNAYLDCADVIEIVRSGGK